MVLEEKEGIGPKGGRGRVLSAQGGQLLEQCKVIAEDYTGRVGIVTFKDAVKEFEAEFGAGNVVHFGALRGTNLLQDVQCLIVAGVFCPPLTAIQDDAAMLYPDRMEPFHQIDEDGKRREPWRPALVQYRLADGTNYHRQHSGFWDDPELSAILEQVRRSELIQAIHRARPNVRECDVWVLTSVPTDEVLDAIYQDLSDSPLAPVKVRGGGGISWKHWIKVKSWLEGMWELGAWIDAEGLAQVAGVQVGTVQSQQWLHAIAQHDPDRWLLESREQEGRGRPRLGIQAVEVSDEINNQT
jgi:hypothetical protein